MARSTTVPGVISAEEVYTLDELKRRMGLGDWAMRQARRAGLKTARIGCRKYVRGCDVQQFLAEQMDAESPN